MRQGRIGRIEGLSVGAASKMASARVVVETPGQGFTEVTGALAVFVEGSGLTDGLATVFCRHTSASLTIQENADPDVRGDLVTALAGFAPRHAGYVHDSEGPDDMPAHIRTMLTDSSLGVPIVGGRLGLGTWQGVYLIEHRDRPHRRELLLTAIGR